VGTGEGGAPALEPRNFAVAGRGGGTLAGEEIGDAGNPSIVLLHGLTATRRYVVHGSLFLPRHGYRLISYDARGHGESDPAPPGGGYSYTELADDLLAAIEERVGEGSCVLVGHSMGAHTIAAHALRDRGRIAGIVAIGPTATGTPLGEAELAYWDRLADGLERGGEAGFVAAIDQDLDPRWRESVLRFTRERISRHRHREAVVRALREVPRSLPFDGLAALEFLDVPTLVVASHDDSDPGHPFAAAEAWAQRLPRARIISEERGSSPLAWQGGRLSRQIDRFCREPAVASELMLRFS
jgi:pimeloyl-ACP methyl ester carboxylesterase